MPIIKVAKHAGFCFGVKKAIEIAEEVASKNSGPTYVLGQLVHNERVIKNLEDKGIVFVDGEARIETALFVPPDPTVFLWSDGGILLSSSGNIYLETKDGSARASVSMNPGGQISF